MKILVVRGNPRKSGVCERFADIFVDGLKSGKAEVFDFDITTSNILSCRGCMACNRGEVGKCVIADDMQKVYDYFSDADALVCVSPVYFYSMSAQLKTFFDRCFPFVRGYGYNAELHRLENDLTFRKNPKKFVTISVASGRLSSSFDALSHTYKTIGESLGFAYCADIKRGESVYFSGLGADSVRIAKVLSAFRTAGEMFAKTGEIENAILEKMELELAPSDEIFSERAKLFWELSKHNKVGERKSADIKVDLRNFAKKVQRQLADAENIALKFTFTDMGESFFVSVNSQKCSVEKWAEQTTPTLELRLTSTLFSDILAGNRNVLSAINANKLIVSDKAQACNLFYKLQF